MYWFYKMDWVGFIKWAGLLKNGSGLVSNLVMVNLIICTPLLKEHTTKKGLSLAGTSAVKLQLTTLNHLSKFVGSNFNSALFLKIQVLPLKYGTVQIN
jgi:hypothetical protein